jgi:hypothetical protein
MANQVIVTSTGNVQVQISRSAITAVTDVENANTANTVVNNAQPNITSVGTLTSLTSTGNITAPFFIGNVVGNISGNLIVPGTNTSVLFNELGNAGASDALKFDYSANVLTANGNIVANYYIGNGSQLTGITATNANFANFAGNAFSVAGANVSGTVANATYSANAGNANTANIATIANSANSVAVANVVGIGNIATVNLDGNVANLLTGNGTFVAIPTVSANANYANFAGTAFNVSGSNVSGEVANATYANSANIANLATFATTANSVAGANVSGFVANATHSNVADVANSVAGSNVSGQVANALVAGTVITNAQPNITSVGTLDNLFVTGNIQGYSNISGDYFIGNGAFLTGVGNFSAALGYHGSFFSNVSQTIASTTTAYPITLNNTSPGSFGVAVTSNSRVTFTYAGTYNIQYSLQFVNTDNAIHTASVWLRKNGTDVPDSTTVYDITARRTGINGHAVGAINYIVEVAANDYYELIWQAESTQISLEYIAPGTTPTSPATPSAIVTAMQVTNVQAATLSGNLTGDLIANSHGFTGVGFINLTGNVTAGQFTGNGSGLTALPGANVTGAVAFATTANSVALANVVGIGNIANINLTGSNSNVLFGNGVFATVPQSNVYGYEIHVSSISGNDTTGTGTLLNPVASITKALTLLNTNNKTIIVHPGSYNESPTVTSQYTVITSLQSSATRVEITGLLTLGIGCTVSGIIVRNVAITATVGTVYINNCNIVISLAKSGTTYVQIDNTDLQTTGAITVTGSGITSFIGGKIYPITVNNASAQVSIKGSVQVVAPVVLAGLLQLNECLVFSTTNTTTCVTSSAGTILALLNCNCVTPIGTAARITGVAGQYSLINTTFDVPNSVITGTQIASTSRFNTIISDRIGNTGNFIIGSNSNAWSFTTQGNLVLPGNTFAVNYANGTQVSIGSVAGVNTSVQFNSNGSFSGTNTFTYNNTTDTLLVGNITANITGQVRFPFNFGDASPRVCANVPANNVVTLAALIFTTAFNDPTATITIGTSGNVGQLLDVTDANPGIVGTYSVEPGHKYNIATEVILTINPGSSTSGGGVLILNYQ